jgi:hypothetical protein
MREVITHQEMVDCRGQAGLTAYLDARRQALIERSGVFNVASGRLVSWCDPSARVTILEARFDSRAWTGLS